MEENNTSILNMMTPLMEEEEKSSPSPNQVTDSSKAEPEGGPDLSNSINVV
jgi:hypothetical protein